MKLILVNFQSEEEINLDATDPVIVGRGSMFGCTDKRVSRKHGQIQLTPEGNVHLLALHSNPFFFMKNGLPPIFQLTKNEEKILSNGDYIGLLPDSFWFKIVVKNNDSENCLEIFENSSNDLKNQSFKEEIAEETLNQYEAKNDEYDLRANKDIEPHEVAQPSKATNVDEEPSKKTKANEEFSKGMETTNKQSEKHVADNSNTLDTTGNWLKERLKALEKTKKLPLFMYEIDDFSEQGKDIDFLENYHDSLARERDSKTKPDEEEDHIEEDSATVGEYGKGPLLDKISSVNTHEKESNVNKEVGESENTAHCSGTNHTEMKASDINSPTKAMSMDSVSSQNRPICQYEEKCYRKNEQHQREFCHPGDPDFIPYAKRPMCQYGASCYRRNKTHHVEFQHPQSRKQKGKSPTDSPKRKRQKKKEETSLENSEEDYEDWEDPFADIDSSDEWHSDDDDDDTDDISC